MVTGVANTVFDLVSAPAFLSEVERKGEKLRRMLRDAVAEKGLSPQRVKDVRGLGLICGIQLDDQAGAVVGRCREKGVLVITAGKGDVIRLVPPLTITDEEIEMAVEVVTDVLAAGK